MSVRERSALVVGIGQGAAGDDGIGLLVARTLAEGGDVEVVAHTNKLHSYRGVGAFLRQTTATGLRGAPPPGAMAPGANQS